MSALDWIYPPRCIACGNLMPLNKRRAPLCENCAGLLAPIAPPVCPRCGAPAGEPPDALCPSCAGKNFYFSYNRSLFIYEDLIREIIHEMKFRNKRANSIGIAEIFAGAFTEIPDFDFFAPVPMHPGKKRERGFNQAEDLAKTLSAKTGVPYLRALRRLRGTPPQSGLSAARRAENMSGVFAADKNALANIKNKKICLADDIFTTGATLNECAKILTENGAFQVSCLTFSIAVKN